MKDHPERFEFPKRMEQTYPNAGAGVGGRRIFRGQLTVDDLRAMSKQPFKSPSDDATNYDLDILNWIVMDEIDMDACGSESCEVDFSGAGI